MLQCHHLRLPSGSVFWLATALAPWFHVPVSIDARIRPPLPPDISHLETLCTVLLSLEVPFWSLCRLSFSLPLSFAFPSCVPPQWFGLQLKLIQAWKGSDDFSWKNCTLFCVCLWTLPLCSCLFYSNTLKQKNKDEKKTPKTFYTYFQPAIDPFANISTQRNETNLSPNLSALLLWHVLYIMRVV